MKLEPFQGGILLKCGVCLQGTSRVVFIGSQGQSCGESCAGGGAIEGPADLDMWPIGWVLGVNQPRCLGFFLAAIWT
jgi:hypothetical protein